LKNPHSFNTKLTFKRELEENDIVKFVPVKKMYFGSLHGKLNKEKFSEMKEKFSEKSATATVVSDRSSKQDISPIKKSIKENNKFFSFKEAIPEDDSFAEGLSSSDTVQTLPKI
jgi:hypothetical protein